MNLDPFGALQRRPGSVSGTLGEARDAFEEARKGAQEAPSALGQAKLTPGRLRKRENLRNRRATASTCALGPIFDRFSVVFRKSCFPEIASTMGE